MDEIRVFPGVSIETEGGQLALKFIRMIGETQEAYVERVQQVTNLALSFVPKSEPAVFDFSDTSKYRQVGRAAWEAITPGYEPQKETTSERDAHFAGWAATVWDELHTLSTRKIDEGDKERYEAMDKEIIARAGYDLVSHSVRYTGVRAYDPATGYASKSIEEVIARDIPDMTAWPEESE